MRLFRDFCIGKSKNKAPPKYIFVCMLAIPNGSTEWAEIFEGSLE